ncbi:MAG TPA: urease accessory protein [Gammaproteobacteria bacterium]|nr:urease accessory protein [Gammaproteobacteria bacterium]
MNGCPVQTDTSGWQASLQLGFERRGARTVLAHRLHRGPLGVQRAFYPEQGWPHVYILHPPGGVVGGDVLNIDVTLQAGAQALVTSPAAAKFYRSAGEQAQLHQHLKLHGNAMLEWLPQETIYYSAAEVDARTRVELDADSRFIGWDMFCLGRPAAGEGFTQGHISQRLEIWREGMPLWLEQAAFAGDGEMLDARWGMAGRALAATLVAVGDTDGLAEQIHQQVSATEGDHFAVSQLDDVLVCRYLGTEAQRARQCLASAWRIIRPQVMGRAACEPRVWNT